MRNKRLASSSRLPCEESQLCSHRSVGRSEWLSGHKEAGREKERRSHQYNVGSGVCVGTGGAASLGAALAEGSSLPS